METRAFASLDETVFTQLGHTWMRDGLITEDQLMQVLSQTSDQDEQFRLLLEQGVLTESQLLRDLSSVMACPFWSPDELHQKASQALSLIGQFPQETLERLAVLPVQRKGAGLLVAIASWPSQEMFATLQRQIQAQSVTFGFAPRSAILQEIKTAYHHPSTLRASLQEFNESWDDWEDPTLAMDNSKPKLEEPPKGSLSGSQENVDALLADFLTPDAPFPGVGSQASQANAPAVRSAQSLPSQEQASSPRLNIRSSHSLDQADEPRRGSQPRGLDALRQSDSGSILGLDGPTSTGSMNISQTSSGVSNMLIAADVKEIKKERAKKGKGKKNLKQDERMAVASAWIMTLVRIVALVGIGYLIYLGYQNGL
ncbi:MAG: hypothetical protein EP343_27325 [Deltaproteobacteria bacterium]|nr:MAG: hypothetical protein EP343_27325 [Deltaproteobacteria bacterium]